jgi:hypothetical protein
MKELRNVIDNDNFEKLQNELFSARVPWYLSGTYSSSKYDNLYELTHKQSPDFSFAHLVYLDGDIRSEFYEPLNKFILNGLEQMGENPTKIIRIKINMCTCQPSIHTNPPHVDTDETHKAGLIYVNTTNAPTVMYNEIYNPRFGFEPEQYLNKILNNKLTIQKIIDCEANKMIAFDGKYYHASSVQSDTYRRIVINFNYTT